MKITAFEIERFGLWSGLTVPKLSGGINVFYGANEAGKSTLMEFVRAELYGFGGERRRYTRRPGSINAPWNAEVDHEGRSLYMISGGVLQMESPSGQFRLRRMFHPDTPGNEESIDLQTIDGNKQGAQLLRVLVSGVDEPTFNNVFAIGLDELQKLGSLNDTEAAEMLFRLSVGMDRVSIVDAIKELTSRRNRILNSVEKENKPSLLTQLFRQREKTVAEIADAKLLVRDYVRIRNEQKTVDRSVANLEEDNTKLQREKRLYEIAKLAEPIWSRRDKVRDEINGMGTVVIVADENITQLDEIAKELERRHFAYNKLMEEYKKAKSSIDALPVNEMLRKLAPRIEVLLEEEKRIVEIDGQITELENEIATLETQVADGETQIKRGRRSLPRSVEPQPTEPRTSVSAVAAESSEHASFNAAGAVISAQTTSPGASVAAKGYRQATASNDGVTAETLDDYRVPAKAVNKTRQRLYRTKEQHAELAGRSKVLNEKIKTELVKRDAKDLSEAIEAASETANNLKRRQGIAQRLNEMLLHHKELRRINAFLIQHQALPAFALALIVFVGILGAVLFGLGLYGFGTKTFEDILSTVMLVLGLLLIVGSFGYKIVAEKSNSRKLEQNQRQLGMLITQLEHTKQEAAAIDVRHPMTGSASIEIRLQEAQQELSQLEKLVPIDTQRREVNQHLKQLEVRLEHCKQEYTAATKRWSDWLRNAGLPSDWTPARIRDLMDHCDVVGDLKKQLDNRYEALNQRIRDMRFITDRIDKMIAESGLSFADGMSYVDILGEIRKKLETNDIAIKQRDKLKDGIRQFRKMRRKVVADLHKAKQMEKDLLRQFSVTTPDGLRELHRRHQKHRRLLQQEQGIQRELDAAIGNFCAENIIGNLLEPRMTRKILEQQAEAELEKQLETSNDSFEYQDETLAEELKKLEKLPELDDLLKDAIKRIEVASAKLHDELELRGQIGEQLKRIADDQTAIKKQRELAIIDEKIRNAISDWQTLAVCARMLDEIRATYERERQPKTLAEASELLKRLTDGKYLRIWTPLGEETLMVDDSEGNTFDVVWLSRGTREQLFIALRLALASAFAQHGSILPLILDDVLVNFDSRRAFAAAQVLLEFAKSGRQIFLFTCHEHVCRMFQKLDIPVRILPAVDDPGKPTKVLLPRSILKRREEKRRRELKHLAEEKAKRKVEQEIADREEQIRLDAVRKAEVQRLILQMQQQATAEKTVEAEQKKR